MKKYSSNEIIEMLKGHRALLKKFSVIRIGLFGSFARNESTATSDIDLLVDFEDKSFDNFMNLADELENIFGRKVDLLTQKGMSPYIFPLIKKEILWYEA